MGFFSGLTGNGLLGAVGRMARAGGGPFAPPTRAFGPGGEDLLDRLRAAMNPQRLAVAQALLAGDHGAVSRMTEPLRRRRLAERETRLAPSRGAHELEKSSATSAGAPGANTTDRGSPAANRHQTRNVPDYLRAPDIPLTSELIIQDRPGREAGNGPWQFDTLGELEAAFDDMAPRDELVAIGRRGGVANQQWLRDMDNALVRRDADPEAAIPFRNFVPQSAQGADAVVRESDEVRADRTRYREALRAKGLNGFGYSPTQDEVTELARIMYAEGLNVPEDFPGVGWLVVNRAGRPGFRPTITEVIHQPGQFEPVREGNPGGRDSANWTRFMLPDHELTETERKRRAIAIETAEGILSGRIPDPTGGTTHMRTPYSPPGWFDDALANRRLELLPYRSKSTHPDRHLFYRETGPSKDR